jgi:hypothetical protein
MSKPSYKPLKIEKGGQKDERRNLVFSTILAFTIQF